MASSSNTFSSALSYALERLGMPNLTLKEEQRKSLEAVYQGSSVLVWLPTGFNKSICYQALPFMIEYKIGQLVAHFAMARHDHLFYVNQICRVGGSLWCLFDSYMRYFFTGSNYSSYPSILCRCVVTEQHAFGIGTHSLFG